MDVCAVFAANERPFVKQSCSQTLTSLANVSLAFSFHRHHHRPVISKLRTLLLLHPLHDLHHLPKHLVALLQATNLAHYLFRTLAL